MTQLKVALTQFELRAEHTVDGFLAHMESLIAEAAAQSADAVVFPELASTGLLASVDDHTVTAATVADDYRNRLTGFTDTIVTGLARMAQEHDVVVIGGSHNRIAEDGSLRNTAYVVFPDGRVASQDKIHLTPPEHAMGMLGGDDLLVTRIGAFTVGVLICADIQFPELSRALEQRGVDLIVCPSLTWNRRGVHRVRTGCQARAMEMQSYVVMSPLIGHSGLPADAPLYAVGRALAAGPVDRTIGSNDGILALATTDKEEIVYADLDRDLLLASREKPEIPGLKLRRPDLYPKLLADGAS
ncbi:nitrilase-related carbon-nitrogen hydrolase [Streptomyces sp. NPDC013978]|uniref:nitrilase-related carbon-nitrogen hydrolase n=1 Tax=Streptomyces sp. NPDC013978 TaxID=3364869 RepID=UPI0036FA62A9